jgi:hypothetical protein
MSAILFFGKEERRKSESENERDKKVLKIYPPHTFFYTTNVFNRKRW